MRLSDSSIPDPLPWSEGIPFAPPRWLTPPRIAIAAIGAGGGTAALAAAHYLSTDAEALALGATLVVGLLLVDGPLRAGTIRAAALGCARAGIVTAALGGGVVGTVIGMSSAVVALVAARARLSPAHDGPDRVLCAAGFWLALVAGACGAVAVGAARGFVGGAVLAGVGSVAAGAWRLRARATWLTAVRRGTVPGWDVVPAPHAPESLGLPALLELPDPLPELGVLRRRGPESPRSYREPPAMPRALVRLREGPSAFDLWRSRVESSMLADPIAACVAALLKGVLVSLLVLAVTVSITTVLVWCLTHALP